MRLIRSIMLLAFLLFTPVLFCAGAHNPLLPRPQEIKYGAGLSAGELGDRVCHKPHRTRPVRGGATRFRPCVARPG